MNEETRKLEENIKHYDEQSFFEKIKTFALKAGRTVIHKSLLLYYTLKDEETPKWAKTVIYGALGYFVLPLDTIPDFIPVAGFTDDFGALTSAIIVVAFYIKDKHKIQAERKLASIFRK